MIDVIVYGLPILVCVSVFVVARSLVRRSQRQGDGGGGQGEAESRPWETAEGRRFEDSRFAAVAPWIGWIVAGPIAAPALLASSWSARGSLLRKHALAATFATVPLCSVFVVAFAISVVGAASFWDPMPAIYVMTVALGVLVVATVVGSIIAWRDRPGDSPSADLKRMQKGPPR